MDDENQNNNPENHLEGFTTDHDVPLFMRDDATIPQAQPTQQPQDYQQTVQNSSAPLNFSTPPAAPEIYAAPPPAPNPNEQAKTFSQFAPVFAPDPVHPRPTTSKVWIGFVGVAIAFASVAGYVFPLAGVILAVTGLVLAWFFTKEHKIAKYSAIGFAAFGVILSIISVTGILQRQPETVAFASEGDGFSLERPVDWSLSRNDEGLAGIVQFSSVEQRDTGSARATINIVAVDTFKIEDTDVEVLKQRFFNSYEASFMKTYDGYEELANVETTVDGEAARKIDADVIDGQQKNRVTITIIYNDDGKKSYIIVNTVDADYFNDYNNLFKTAIRSFDIIE